MIDNKFSVDSNNNHWINAVLKGERVMHKLKIQHKYFDDIVYTPETLSKEIIETLPLYGKVLDPCRGAGAFYDNLPDHLEKDGCEIDEGKDFFKYNEKVDGIITNPPYSILSDFMEHCFKISDNVALLVPLYKFYSSQKRLRTFAEFGDEIEIYIVPKKPEGGTINFPLGVIGFKRRK